MSAQAAQISNALKSIVHRLQKEQHDFMIGTQTQQKSTLAHWHIVKLTKLYSFAQSVVSSVITQLQSCQSPK